MRIGIIGGGLTGLTAAYRLVENEQADVTVYEASDRLGGLAAGFELDGHRVEQAYHDGAVPLSTEQAQTSLSACLRSDKL